MRSELYPEIDIPSPMLVGKAPTNYSQLVSKSGWLGSIKKDGYFEFICRAADGTPYMFSRSISKKTGFFTEKIDNVPHLKEWIVENLPPDTIICSEAYLPNGTSKNITSILGCLPAKAIDRQNGEYGKLNFWLHDIIKYDGKDYIVDELTYGKRYSNLCQYIDCGTNLIPEVQVAPIFDSVYVDLVDITGKLLAEGEEGIVIRSENGLYLPGKRRPNIMFKIKQAANDIDVVVTDILPPVKEYTGKCIEDWPYWIEYTETDSEGNRLEHRWTPEKAKEYNAYKQYKSNPNWYCPVTKAYYYGWGGALEISLSNRDGTWKIVGSVASGLTDEDKQDMGENPKNWLWHVAELSAMSVDKNAKSIRHPVFVRVRDDKVPEECTVESVFGE